MSSSVNKLKTEPGDNKHPIIVKYTPKTIFSKYLTIDELKRHPEITPAIKGDKKIRLDILSNQKPRMINLKEIKNQNKVKFASRLNSFHKLFFDYCKNSTKSKDEINILNHENKVFSKKYHNANKNNNNKEKFNDIKLEYEKRNYYVSPLEGKKNLFNGNILLSNKEELKNYILYDLGTSLSNSKSLSFLHKINKNLGDKTSEKELKRLDSIVDLRVNGKDKMEKDQKYEIQKTENDIMNIKETINSIDDINQFFTIDNKHYLETLKANGSRDSSAKISTRVNSACFENVKYQNNINNINDLKNYMKNYQNRNNDNQNNQVNNDNVPNKNNNIKTRKKGSQVHRNSGLSNIDDIFNNNHYQKSNSRNHFKTIDNNELSKSPLEKLYDKISTKDNLLNYQSDINKFLKNKKYDISIKINPSSLCNNFEKTREKITHSVFLKNDMYLRKQISGNLEFAEKVNDNDMKAIQKVNVIEDKIIKLFCDINNPKKKAE
jgi:hypothetical protein